MRSLKFRVWSEEDREYRSDIKVSDLAIDIDGVPSTIYSPEGDRFDIEQYTGLKDKNGKEIYEGDRIKIEGSDTIYTVEYGRGVWVARFGDESGNNICLYHYVRKDTVLYTEVIGNIHENPELVGEEEE